MDPQQSSNLQQTIQNQSQISQATIQLYEQRLQILQNQVLKKQQQDQELSSLFNSAKLAIAQQEKIINQHQEKEREWETQKSQMQKDLVVLKGQLVTAQSFAKLKDSMNSMKQQTIQRQEDEIKELKKQLNQKQTVKQGDANNTEKDSIEVLRAKITSLQILITQSDSQQTHLIENYKKLEETLREQTLTINDLTLKLQISEQNLSSSQLSFEAQISNLQQEKLNLQENIQQIQIANQNEKDLIQQDYQSKIQELQGQITESLQRFNQLTNDMDNEQKESQQLRDQIQVLREEIVQYQKFKQQQEDLNNDLKAKKQHPENSQDKIFEDKMFRDQIEVMKKMIEMQTKIAQEERERVNVMKRKEIEQTIQFCQIKDENERLKLQNKQLGEIQELEQKVQILEEALEEANQVNQNLSAYYHQSKKDVKSFKLQLQQQEQLVSILRDQYSELQKEVPLIETEYHMKNLFYQLHLRCSVILQKQFQNSSNAVEQKEFIQHLKEIEKSKIQERALYEKLIKIIQKNFQVKIYSKDQIQQDFIDSSIENKLKKIFLYLEEQLNLLRLSRDLQDQKFEKIKSQIHQSDHSPVIESLNQQIQVLQQQLELMKNQEDTNMREISQMKSKIDKMNQEQNQKSKLVLEYRTEIIKLSKELDINLAENSAKTLQVKELERQLAQIKQELQDSLNHQSQLSEYIQKLSLIGNEFKKATFDETMSKLLAQQNVQINEYKVRETQLKLKITELEGNINIIKENYECMRGQILEKAYLQQQTKVDTHMTDATITNNEYIQTDTFVDQTLIDLLNHDYGDLDQILSTYQSHIDQLFKLFYAYSRQGDELEEQRKQTIIENYQKISDQKMQEKESEYKEKQKEIETEVEKLKGDNETMKNKLENQHRYITQMQAKMKNLQQASVSGHTVVQTQHSMPPVQTAQVLQPSRVVVSTNQQQALQPTQQQNVQSSQIQQQVQELQQKLQDQENLNNRIKSESSHSLRIVNQINKEQRQEIERLQNELRRLGDQGESTINPGGQLSGNQVVGKLMGALQKSKKIIMGLVEGKPEMQEIVSFLQQSGVTPIQPIQQEGQTQTSANQQQ